jgi:TRAP-type C4-dicarboxylate transport system permease small subunit
MAEGTMERNLENEPILLFEERSLKPKGIFDKVVINSLSGITIFCSLALSLLIAAAAFMRYVVRGDLYGYEEWVKLIAFWLYFMGGAYGAYNDTHVSADMVDSYFPEGKPRQVMVFIRQLITSVMSLVFTYFGYYFFMYGLLGPLKKDVLTIGWDGVGLLIGWDGVGLTFSSISLAEAGLVFSSIDFAAIRAIARTTVWQIPLWTSYAAIFLGLILMSVYFTRRCVHTGIALFRAEGGKKS